MAQKELSSGQMKQALEGSLRSLREQLEMLRILDGRGHNWPGVTQAVDDLEVLAGSLQSREGEAMASRDEASAQFARQDSTIRAQGDEIRELKADLKSKGRDLDKLERENKNLAEKEAAARAALAKAEGKMEYMEGELEGVEAELKEALEDAAVLRPLADEVEPLRAELAALKDEHAERTAELRASMAEAAGATADLARVRGEVERLTRERELQEAALERLERQSAGRQVEAEKARQWQAWVESSESAQLKVTVGEKEARLKEAEDKIRAKERSLKKQTSEAVSSGLEVKRLQQDAFVIKGEMRALKAEAAQLAAEKGREERARRAADFDLQECRKEVAELEVTVAQLRGKLATAELERKGVEERAEREANINKALGEGWRREADLKQAAIERLEDEARHATAKLALAERDVRRVQSEMQEAEAARGRQRIG